jgi:hypothetical protein
MACVCLHFMCEQARHRARAAEQPPHAVPRRRRGSAQGSTGHSNSAPSPQPFLPGFAAGFPHEKAGCAGLGASSSSLCTRHQGEEGAERDDTAGANACLGGGLAGPPPAAGPARGVH